MVTIFKGSKGKSGKNKKNEIPYFTKATAENTAISPDAPEAIRISESHLVFPDCIEIMIPAFII